MNEEPKNCKFKFLAGGNITTFCKNPVLWRELFDKQEGCCAICEKHQAVLKRTMCIDHNHKTGVVRALLCSQCNFLIGNAYENIKVLKNAIDYLEKHK